VKQQRFIRADQELVEGESGRPYLWHKRADTKNIRRNFIGRGLHDFSPLVPIVASNRPSDLYEASKRISKLPKQLPQLAT
jgi:hypothetical protein